jgi:hypothetical protein
MTEQEAQEMIAEIRTEYPQKRVGRTLYRIRRDGRIEEYRLTKSGKRAIYERTLDRAEKILDPEARSWALARLG